MPSYCCSSSDFLQSHYTVLLSSFLLPFSCTSWCCCSLPCISQILRVQIVSFSVLSFCRTDQEFLQWSRVFSSDDVCQGSHWPFNCCRVEGGDHWLKVCVFIVHDGERCKFATYHSLEGFQHIGIFQLFEVKLESCVFGLADSFPVKLEDLWKRQHHWRHMEHKDRKSCRETPGTNTRNGQVQMEHPWTLWNGMEELRPNNNRGRTQGFLQWKRE